MLKDVLTSAPVIGLAAGLVLYLLGLGVRKLILVLAAHPKLAPLEPIAADAGTALADAVNAAEADLKAGKAPGQIALDAGKAALADAKADLPDVEKAVSAEVLLLVNGVPATAVVAPGGAVVNLPSPAPKTAGVIPLIVVICIAIGVAIAGGGIALVATGNGSQELSCIEQDINGNPAAVGNLVSSLSTNVGTDIESALQSLGPTLAKCTLLDLWDDTKADLARKAALKADAKLVAPTADLVNAAQVASVARGWYPAGILAGTTGTAQSGTIGASSTSTGTTSGK
jgi:hypothetical protein